MGDGTIKRAHELKKGDEVLSLNGETAKLKCIVETKLYKEV